MNYILLSGGSGKRLWPLSNEIRSKQFLSLFKREDGAEEGLLEQGEKVPDVQEGAVQKSSLANEDLSKKVKEVTEWFSGEEESESGDSKKNLREPESVIMESMVQRMVRGIRRVSPEAKITFATSKSQVAALHHQLGDDIEISVEPMRRDTFPAIALSCLYLRDVLKVSEKEPIVICPIDPFVEEGYFEALAQLSDLAGRISTAHMYVLGINPTYPSEKYGYILPKDVRKAQEEELFDVSSFKEKPDIETAKDYIAKGALWNGGVFAFQLKYICNLTKRMTGHASYEEMLAGYEALDKISFDYAVAEKEKYIRALKYDGAWKDIGTWNTFAESMSESIVGRAVIDDTCENVHVINELDTPILCMGLKDTVVVAAPDGMLVADKHQSSYMKSYVDTFTDPARIAMKAWGEYRVIDGGDDGLVIRVTLTAGNRMHYHSHARRDESWSVLSGEGEAVIDGKKMPLRKGSVVEIPRGVKHTLVARTNLRVIEVQSGSDIDVADKTVYDMPE